MAVAPRVRLALLIDAENLPARLAPELLDCAESLGDLCVRRAYGDFTDPHLRGWVEASANHSLAPRQVFTACSGKNSSDIALVIEAMDLLHAGRCDALCLASSDADFTHLAVRVREHGLPIYGYGEAKAPQRFRLACTRFEELDARPDASRVMALAMQGPSPEDGWVDLGLIGQRIQQAHPGFDYAAFGASKLKQLVATMTAYELKARESGGMLVRRRRNGAGGG